MKCRIKDLAEAQRHRRRLDLQHPLLSSIFCWSCRSVFLFYHHQSLLFLSRLLNSVVISPSLICSTTFWSVLRCLSSCLSPSLSRDLVQRRGLPLSNPPITSLIHFSAAALPQWGVFRFSLWHPPSFSFSLFISHSLPSVSSTFFCSFFLLRLELSFCGVTVKVFTHLRRKWFYV